MNVLLGVDIGTQGTKAALFTEHGQCLSQAFRASKPLHPEPGAVEEDPQQQFSTVCQTIKQCVQEAGVSKEEVAGIGIDGQMAGVMGVGKDGRHVTPYDSWLDRRCAPYIQRMGRTAGDLVLAKTGCAPSFNHGPKKLWWKHQRKKAYRQIAAFVQPSGYAAMRLCGLDGSSAFLDTTYLHFSGFADNRRSRWDDELCQLFKFDRDKLPRIVPPETVVGEVAASVARKCGLRRGVPVVAGCGDTAASLLACGATREGICVDVAGTASVFAATTSKFRADRRHHTLVCGQSTVAGLWHSYAYINGGGMNLPWFRQKILQGVAEGPSDSPNLDALNVLASTVRPVKDLPMFIPHLGGRVSPSQPDLRGAWIGLTWDHSTAHLYRAMLEGVVLEYALYQKIVRALHKNYQFRELRITGGGEKSLVWNQMKADALQMPVRRIGRWEGAPLGAALLAGYGVGLLKNLPAAAQKWIHLGERFRPRKAFAEYYQQRLVSYQRLLSTLDGALDS